MYSPSHTHASSLHHPTCALKKKVKIVSTPLRKKFSFDRSMTWYIGVEGRWKVPKTNDRSCRALAISTAVYACIHTHSGKASLAQMALKLLLRLFVGDFYKVQYQPVLLEPLTFVRGDTSRSIIGPENETGYFRLAVVAWAADSIMIWELL